MINRMAVLTAAVALLSAGVVRADIMPSFAGAPAGWSTDRYAPSSFTDVGTFQGKDHVLGITISTNDGLTNRPAAYQSTFYNTQGMGNAVTGGIGSEIGASLYIPLTWNDPTTNGSVRTDMWGVMTDGTAVTDYPIIGFTNYGGAPRYRIWDGNIGWVDLATPVAYDAWTTFGIRYDGTDMEFSINGIEVASYVENAPAPALPTTGFSAAIMQAYNFAGDRSISGANPQNYTANWANTPEPGSYVLLLTVAVGIAAMRRKIQSRA